MAARFVLHHTPQSRAQRILWLLEESGESFEIVAHDFAARTHKTPEFLALNPDGKLPTLVDRGPDGAWETVVTESAAIVIHVADASADDGLAPAPSHPDRGAYLNWIVYMAAALEPALADAAFPRAEPPPPSAIGWPPYEATVARLAAQLANTPYILGDHFSAADVMVGAMLAWTRGWGRLPEPERFDAYLARLSARPAYKRAYGG
ncbi:glutathione S-transferase [Methylopila capsulata]|uniref:Glutathione S-transferase n=1 Tax=Methylopila capsulata TaxID=61654 RepID=A0A9W6MQV0_9HYPH|nr:glutathione S-transferase family protein [Methylopila capsulata]MBM7851298.1 glutathione S-transferase [Methylopila capsulata]GLK54356.1 glutathione S-transferase [Methylopila capsulata]